MKYLSRFNESKEIDHDFLEDCFIELIDMGICQINRAKVLDRPGFGASITVSNFSKENIWGNFDFGGKIIDDLIESSKKELEILEMVKESCRRVEISEEYLTSYSLVVGEIDSEGKSIYQKVIIVQIVKK